MLVLVNNFQSSLDGESFPSLPFQVDLCTYCQRKTCQAGSESLRGEAAAASAGPTSSKAEDIFIVGKCMYHKEISMYVYMCTQLRVQSRQVQSAHTNAHSTESSILLSSLVVQYSVFYT